MSVLTREEAVERAQSYLAVHHPDAIIAILGGSYVWGNPTESSDLDCIIISDDERSPYRVTRRFSGTLIEAFVYRGIAGWRQWITDRTLRNDNVILHISANGLVICDTTDQARAVQQEAKEMLDVGPPPITDVERDLFRYMFTAALDDLADCPANEILPLASLTLSSLLDGSCMSKNAWIGRGKWKWRYALIDTITTDAFQAALTAASTGDREPFLELGYGILEALGGRLHTTDILQASPKEEVA